MPDHDPPPTTDPLAGKVIEGRWRLIQKLGEGGMGAVYLAEQLSIRGRRVAVKLLRAEFAQNPEFLRRFRGEAERAAAVSDPRIVMVLDFGQAETGELFLVMEYVVGDTLADLMRCGPLPLARALVFGAQLAEAPHCVHQAGVIHRDVKPANAVIRHGSDDLKLMDFGIARSVDDQEQTQLTQTGLVVGTPAFMAPEQIKGGVISPQTDIYAWGVVMYAMLAGRRPFEASSATAVQYMHVHEPPPALVGVRPAVPPDIERIVMRALAKAPEDRQRTMAEVAHALRAVRLPVSGDLGVEVTKAERGPGPGRSSAHPRVTIENEGTVVPAAPRVPRSRRGLVLSGGAVLAVVGLMAVFAWPPARESANQTAGPTGSTAGGSAERSAVAKPGAAADSADPARADLAATRAAPPSSRATPAAALPPDVADALALARFFLDRGEYDSALEELARARRAAPDNEDLQQALAAAQKAQAAEAAVLGGR